MISIIGKKKSKKIRSVCAFLLCVCMLMGCFFQSGVFAAVEQKAQYRVTFHDMDVNGEEILSSKKAVSLTVGEDDNLAETIEKKNIRVGSDKRNAADLVWYTLDEDGEKELFDLDTAVEEDLDLYTYTYGIRLIEGQEYGDFWSGLDPEVVAYINKYSAGVNVKTTTASNADAEISTASLNEDEDGSEDMSDIFLMEENESALLKRLGIGKAKKQKKSFLESIVSKFSATASDAAEENEEKISDDTDENEIGDLLDEEQKEMLADALSASRFIRVREGDPVAILSSTAAEDTEWTDLETGETVDLQAIAEEGVSENITVYAAVNGATVYCYVIVDGKEHLVEKTVVSTTANIASQSNRYYISAEKLEEIYGSFGFSADSYKGEHCFPHGDTNDTTRLWADQTPTKIEGEGQMIVPLSHRSPIYLFYMPDIKDGKEKYITQTGGNAGSFLRTENSAAYLANTFYSLTVADPDGIAYEDQADIPEVQYVYHGKEAEIKVPKINSADGEWVLTDEKGNEVEGVEPTSSENDEVVYKFSGLSQAYVLTAVSKAGKVPVNIECYAIVNGSPQKVETIRTAYAPEKASGWDTERYYVTADELEEIYGKFGFSAASYQGKLVFPYTDDSSDRSEKLWANTDPVQITNADGTQEWRIPVSEQKKAYLFYLPSEKNEQNDYDSDKACENPLKGSAGSVIANNSFYTVTVKDTNHLTYTDDASIPGVQYVLTGQDADITVKKIADTSTGHWEVYNDNDDTDEELDFKLTGDKNGLVTYQLSSVNCPVRFETVKENPRVFMPLECYAVVDGKMTLIQTLTRGWGPVVESDPKWGWSSTTEGRYYITASELESVYGAFGFKASTLEKVSQNQWHEFASNHRIFANADNKDQKKIWTDVLMTKHGSEVRIPLCWGTELMNRIPLRIYYLPDNVSGEDGYFPESQVLTKEEMLSNNTFYALTVSDPQGDVYEKKSDIPAAQYTRGNETLSVKVTKKENVTWAAYKSSDNTLITDQDVVSCTDNQDGTLTYTVDYSKIAYSVTIRPESEVKSVIYNASVENGKIQVSGDFKLDNQITVQDETIHGFSTYADPIPEDSSAGYTVLGTDTGYAVVQEKDVKKGRRLFYTFEGWTVEESDSEVVIEPGTVLKREQLEDYVNTTDGNVHLKAKWRVKDGKGRIESVNFYVNRQCEIMDNTSNGFNSSSENDSEYYSNRVYSTRLNGGDSLPDGGNMHVVMAPKESDNAYDTDSLLRKSAKNSITKFHNENPATPLTEGPCEVTLASFPSDEEVLEQLRLFNQDVTMGGVKIDNEYLTTDHFAVRWYVLKYLNSDGWHVDGVLVAKKGRFAVKKTFVGDSETIDGIKQNYQIAVTHEDDTTGNASEDYKLVLKEAGSAGLSAKETGYTKYDEKTNTYTWVVDARQGRKYRIKEENYTVGSPDWSTSCYYMIRNSSADTGGWRSYDLSGVSLTAGSYANDVPDDAIQTAEFRNVYVQAGLLTIHTIDNATKNGLSGVNYQISGVEDPKGLTLYRKPETCQYSADANDHKKEYTEVVDDNIVQTDANGNFFIKLPNGTYDLKEEFPTGYDGAKSVQIRVTEGGALQYIGSVTEPDTQVPSGGWIEPVSASEITIKNRSKLLTTVTANKNWDNTPESERRKVVVELWCDGIKLPESTYKQELSAENNWTYEWNMLPLFMDGKLANYSLKETMIGDIAYDAGADENDGYKEYIVTYNNPLYKQGENGNYSELGAWRDKDGVYQYSDHALLKVNNRPEKGEISFTKRNRRKQILPGAGFTLYSDKECNVPIAKATSSDAGVVTFGSQIAGTYYMKETSAPVGYYDNPNTYQVVLEGGRSTITEIESKTELTEIQNTSKMILILKNVDAEKDGNEEHDLGGAEFKISLQNGSEGTCLVAKGGTSITGVNSTENQTEGLPEGDYLFQETKAPRGYERRGEILRVRLKEGKFSFVLTKNGEDTGDTGVTEYSNWELKQKDQNDPTTWILTVKHDKLYKLPSVGGPGMYVVFFFGTGFMCMAAAVLILPAKKKKRRR